MKYTPTIDSRMPATCSQRMAVRKTSLSASTVTIGMAAMIRAALEAEVSLMPRDSKKKYTVTPVKPLASSSQRCRRLKLASRMPGSRRRRSGSSRAVAIRKRRATMVAGGKPVLSTALELTKDRPHSSMLASTARVGSSREPVFAVTGRIVPRKGKPCQARASRVPWA
jgi:hypothetical protein